MKSKTQSRIEQMERERARLLWAALSAEERAHRVANHYCRLANVCAHLMKAAEVHRETSGEPSALTIAYLYDIIERDHLATFGVAPAWSVIRKKE